MAPVAVRSRLIDTWRTSAQTPLRPTWSFGSGGHIDGGAKVSATTDQHPGSSSDVGTPHRPARWPASGGGGRRSARAAPVGRQAAVQPAAARSGRFSTSSWMRASNLTLPDHADLETEVTQRPAQVVLDCRSPSTAAACDASTACAVSDCVTSSHGPDDKAPPASSAPCRARRCGRSC